MKNVRIGKWSIWATHHWRDLWIARSRHFWASWRRYPGVVVMNLLGFEVAVLRSDGGERG